MFGETLEKYLHEEKENPQGRFLRTLRSACQRLQKEDDLRVKLDLILAGTLSGMCIPKEPRSLNAIHVLVQQLLRNSHGKAPDTST